MKNIKWVWFTAFHYVVPAEYENWFEKMEQDGWHVNKIGQWSSIAMKFVRAESRKYRYVFDMQAFPRKDYVSTYEQFGWELVGQMASAFIWRMAYQGDRPEAFTDGESIKKRNTRTMAAVSVSFVMFLLAPLLLAIPLLFPSKPLSQGDETQLYIAMAASFICAMLLLIVILKIKSKSNPK